MQLQGLRAKGGDDNAENVLGALHRLRHNATWQWSGQAKFIILIADAPGHGLCDAAGGLRDDYRGGDPNGIHSVLWCCILFMLQEMLCMCVFMH